jgi:rhomboid protease GluP
MSTFDRLWDRLLKALGTNRVKLGFWWRSVKKPSRGPQSSLIPDDFPLVPAFLLGLCVVFYLLCLKMTSDLSGEAAFTPAPIALVRYGATLTGAIQLGEWWRTCTSVFLHGNIPHILMNGLGLWSVGTVAEQRFGRSRTLVVFVVSGTLGMVASVLWHPVVLGVGASGAIFGLIGAIVTHSLRHRGRAGARELRERFVPWLLFALVMGLAVKGVDNAAHLGGLAAGALCGLVVGERGSARRVRWVWEIAAAATAVAVATAFYAAATSPLVNG